MKAIRRSRRLRLLHRKPQSRQSIESDNDESDIEHYTLQEKSTIRSNKNANRIPTTLFDTITYLPIEEKPHQILHSSSDQSSLFLYSINSIQKPVTNSDDLTPLTETTTNTTPLTALTYSNTKQTETTKIDLTQLSGTDTLDSSSTNTDHDHSLSLDRKFSSSNINNKINNTKDLTQIYDTDTSMKSVVFSKDNSLEQELSSYHKHLSCFTILGVGNGDCMTTTSPSIMEDILVPATVNTNINICQRSPVRWNPSRWNLQNLTMCIEDDSFRRYHRLRSSIDSNSLSGTPFIIISVSVDDYFAVLNCSTPQRVSHDKLDWYFQKRASLNSPRVIWQRGRSNIHRYTAYSPDQIQHYLQIKSVNYNDSGTYICIDQTTGFSDKVELIVRKFNCIYLLRHIFSSIYT
ncbi:unnamed protein product [Rotaria sp. Silwood2]|nr:unnamed protein product [Rotaria sp. Silwood2]CAF4079307.1 unnamed protein product [Rotaria sp. Silwood2]CAF4091646.1 unnamed protein product [Rotaria sp. Silwood2]